MKRKDLAGALSFLKSIDDPVEAVNGSVSLESTRSRLAELGLVVGYERDWEVLDTCLNADDMKLVCSAYGFLKDRGFLSNFGKCRNIGIIFFSLVVMVTEFVEKLVQNDFFFLVCFMKMKILVLI